MRALARMLLLSVWLGGIAAPATAQTLMPAAARAEPGRHIVVTVTNPPARRPGSVGGTVRGYQGGGYRASAAAIAKVAALSRKYGLTLISAWPIEQLQMHCAVFRVAQGASRESVLERVRADTSVLIAQPLNEFESTASGYDDPYAKLQENIRTLRIEDAHRVSRGEGIRIAVIDTGIDSEHPDLSGRVEIVGNYVDDDPEALRSDRHGTQVAGLIGAAANNGVGIVGVAPGARVLGFKACWHEETTKAGRCNSFTLAQALAGAIAARANIINLSLIGPADPLLEALVEHALAARIVVIGAAGSAPRTQSFPAGVKGVLAVTESETELADAALLRAPGRDIVTLVPQGHYDFASGSSLATAQVSGVAALLLARNRRLSATDVGRILQASMSQREASTSTGTSVNACAALAMLVPRSQCGGAQTE